LTKNSKNVRSGGLTFSAQKWRQVNIMYTEEILHQKPAVIKIFTGLPAAVFWQLVAQVEAKIAAYNRHRHQRPGRQRAVGGGRHFDLPLAIRVALVLTYLRHHMPQQVVAAMYHEATQSDVSRQLRLMLPLLAEVLPCPEVWDKLDADHPLSEDDLLELVQLSDGQVIIDATEQQIYRPEGHNDLRKPFYSGKKKQFTLKTQVVIDGQHHIVAITITLPGATSDKKLADQTRTVERLPDDCHAQADKGYQGLTKQVAVTPVENQEAGQTDQLPRLTLQTPFKKPPKGELTPEQKAFNQVLGAIRVRVEHCIGWVKNWDILSSRFRCDHAIYTLVMQVVCGLVNLQTERWQTAKALSALAT